MHNLKEIFDQSKHFPKARAHPIPGSTKFLLFAIALLILKLYLVANLEILEVDAPHDDLWFAKAAFFLIHQSWLGNYDYFTLIRQPGYPIMLSLIGQTGIPLRIAFELCLAGGAFIFFLSLKKNGFPWWLCLSGYILTLFHPVTYYMNDRLLCENLYTPLIMASLGTLFFCLREPEENRRIKLSLAAGLPLALAWNTRHETIWLASFIALFLIFDFWLQKKTSNIAIACKRTGLLMLPLLCIMLVLTCGLRWKNFNEYALFQTSEMYAPGFKALNSALVNIKDGPSRRYVTVSSKTRQKVYEVSPTFQKLKPFLEGGILTSWIRHGCPATGVCDDYIAALFLWGLRDSANLAGFHQTAVSAEAYYRKIEQEIKRACSSNSLECRKQLVSFMSFMGPNLWELLPQAARSFQKLFGFLKEASFSSTFEPRSSRNFSAYESIFNEIANRRIQLLETHKTPPPFTLRRAIESAINKTLAKSISFLHWLFLPLAALWIAQICYKKTANHLDFIVFLLAFLVAMRLLIFAFFDASAAPLNVGHIRYIYPAMPFYAVLILAILFIVLEKFGLTVKGRR